MIVMRRLFPQPLIGLVLSLLAGIAVSHAWLAGGPAVLTGGSLRLLLVAGLLILVELIADRFPIHVHYHTKVAISSIPLYLMAVLLPPPLAIVAAGLSVLLSELRARSQRGSYASDIASSTSRSLLVVWAGTWIAQVPVTGEADQALLFAATAVVMLVGDLSISALEVAAMAEEPPGSVLRRLAREAGPLEAVQYLVGWLGAWVAVDHLWVVAALGLPASAIYVTFKRIKELQHSTRQLLESMADAVDLRDPYTGGHSRRVTDLCAALLQELAVTGPDAELILMSARVHDIGKIGIPDGILNKPGQLTAAERAIMETHPARGAALVAQYRDFARGTAIVRHHHERWDGQGYPDGMADYAIPFGARVLAVADSFDAMTSDRPYRNGMSAERALQILREGRGTQWDAQIVDAFVRRQLRESELMQAEQRTAVVESLPLSEVLTSG